MSRILTNAMNAQAKAVKVDFKVTTQTWDHQPDFAITSPRPYVRQVSTDDPVYSMLNKGTPAHDIAPKNAKGVLAFNAPFRPKSRPGYIGSNKGMRGNTPVIRRTVVHHPGTTARAWTKAIKTKWDREFPTQLQRAIDSEY